MHPRIEKTPTVANVQCTSRDFPADYRTAQPLGPHHRKSLAFATPSHPPRVWVNIVVLMSSILAGAPLHAFRLVAVAIWLVIVQPTARTKHNSSTTNRYINYNDPAVHGVAQRRREDVFMPKPSSHSSSWSAPSLLTLPPPAPLGGVGEGAPAFVVEVGFVVAAATSPEII